MMEKTLASVQRRREEESPLSRSSVSEPDGLFTAQSCLLYNYSVCLQPFFLKAIGHLYTQPRL